MRDRHARRSAINASPQPVSSSYFMQKMNVPPRGAARFFILLPGLPLSTRRRDACADSKLPQVPILKENCWYLGWEGLQTLAPESPHIVAFLSASTTCRAGE